MFKIDTSKKCKNPTTILVKTNEIESKNLLT